jgi:hypothetical protein
LNFLPPPEEDPCSECDDVSEGDDSEDEDYVPGESGTEDEDSEDEDYVPGESDNDSD